MNEHRPPGIPILRCLDVGLAFCTGSGPVQILADVCLVVDPGDFVAVTGRSGSGKTTLLLAITGFQRLDRGQVLFRGLPLSDAPIPWRDMAFVPQTLGLLDELTIRENVLLPSMLDPGSQLLDPDLLMESLGVLHLADARPRETSFGEQQRATIARALLLQPALLVADEPVAHQDKGWATRVIAALHQTSLWGGATLVATHGLEFLPTTARTYGMADGRVTGVG